MKNIKKIKIFLAFSLTIIIFISSLFTIKTSQALDSDPPKIIINYAGNFKDSGGPLWRPPDEGIPLIGFWRNGYYTNDSRQSEDWMYIHITVTDDSYIDVVWLQWLNDTTWTNWTYKFVHTFGNFYTINTSTFFTTSQGFNYSFDVVANDTLSNSGKTCWYKIGVNGNLTRRYVQLNCQKEDISYSPFYLHESERLGDSGIVPNDDDRLHHDQGPPCGDTGYLTSSIPGFNLEYRTCGTVIAYWFDESVCLKPLILDNIYFHIWWSTKDSSDMNNIGWDKSRACFENNYTIDSYTAKSSNNRSYLHYDGLPGSNDYYLETHLLEITDTKFSDNDIYEFVIKFRDNGGNPTVICNRSIMSFILLNVPDNTTLNNTFIDSDHEGLTDWQELYVTYTNPFVSDTDKDGRSDFHEFISGSDSNDYKDFKNYPPNKPSIKGPTHGKTGEFYKYTFSVSDPEKDSIYLNVDWGDENIELYGPFLSNSEIRINHTWNKKGTYLIRAQTKDIFSMASDWETLEIKMPTKKQFSPSNYNPIYWLVEQFPNAFPLLRFFLIH